jgi:hypothetical protein
LVPLVARGDSKQEQHGDEESGEKNGCEAQTLQVDYRTCKVVALTTEGFDCLVAGSKLRFKKVPNGFPLS